MATDPMLPNNPLLDDIKTSIVDMQIRMQSTYTALSQTVITGESQDKTVKIHMFATYVFQDIDFDERALKGGVKEFKWRIREAWKDLSDKIQKMTQSKTVELLQSMHIPDEIKNLSVQPEEEDKRGE
jgi:DNA-binding protein YbaB